ncbi:hypothetical protein J4669_21370, partial [Salmonella sp. 32031103201600241SM]|nr:hypothetical protein [Salmonella sp. 32031103201600241SM]
SFAAFWLHNNKGRLTRGCNPTSSKFIHTWLRFGEIMRGSLSATPVPPIASLRASVQVLAALACFAIKSETAIAISESLTFLFTVSPSYYQVK